MKQHAAEGNTVFFSGRSYFFKRNRALDINVNTEIFVFTYLFEGFIKRYFAALGRIVREHGVSVFIKIEVKFNRISAGLNTFPYCFNCVFISLFGTMISRNHLRMHIL